MQGGVEDSHSIDFYGQVVQHLCYQGYDATVVTAAAVQERHYLEQNVLQQVAVSPLFADIQQLAQQVDALGLAELNGLDLPHQLEQSVVTVLNFLGAALLELQFVNMTSLLVHLSYYLVDLVVAGLLQHRQKLGFDLGPDGSEDIV